VGRVLFLRGVWGAEQNDRGWGERGTTETFVVF